MRRSGYYCDAVEDTFIIMTKHLKIILISVVLALILNILLGRWLTAQISTIPALNRWKLLSPQAPIVINNREEIRISDSGDILQAIQDAKSKISSVVILQKGQMNLVGGAINLTGEGVFVTAGLTFAPAGD